MWKCKLTAEWNTEEFVFLILSSIPVFPPRVLSALGTVNYNYVRADCKKRERKAAQRSWTSNSLQRFKKKATRERDANARVQKLPMSSDESFPLDFHWYGIRVCWKKFFFLIHRWIFYQRLNTVIHVKYLKMLKDEAWCLRSVILCLVWSCWRFTRVSRPAERVFIL